MTERLCDYVPCRKPLTRKEGEKSSQWASRRFCDIYCAARSASGSTIVADIRERECVCGDVMRRRDNESMSRFAARKFCSPQCSSRNQSRPVKPPVVRETKSCVVCGGLMQRRKTETKGRFQARECCSTLCAAKQRRTEDTAAAFETGRVCGYPACGKPLTPKEGEAPRRFASRKFCSRSCGTANRNTARPVVRDESVETKLCAQCGAVMRREPRKVWTPKKWEARKHCGHACAAAARHSAPVASSAYVIPDAPKSKPQAMWRPPGWSKIPNQWAGHRPPEPDPVEGVAS